MRFVVALLLATCCFGDVSRPLIGWIRDGAGNLRPVHGITGAFVLGESVAEGVTSASFDGKHGVVNKDGQTFRLHADGTLAEDSDAVEPAPQASAEGTTLLLERRAVRLELPEQIERIDMMGDGWLAVRTASAIYAVLTTEGKEQAFRLPEAQP